MWTGHRESVRWSRERKNREAQWRREREAWQQQWQREDRLRWKQDRQQCYARLIAALNEWDAQLTSALATRELDARLDEHIEIDTAEMDRLGTATRLPLALVQLMGSAKVHSLAESAVHERWQLRLLRLTNVDATVAEIKEKWAIVFELTTSLREAMREDLGLEIAPEDPGGSPLWRF